MATKKSYTRGPIDTSCLKQNMTNIKKWGAASWLAPFYDKAHNNIKVDVHQQWQNKQQTPSNAFVLQATYESNKPLQLSPKCNVNTKITLLLEQLQLNPYNHFVHKQLAVLYQQAGLGNKALAHYRKAQALKQYNSLNGKQKPRRHNPLNDNFEIDLENLIAAHYSPGKGIIGHLSGFVSKLAAAVAILFLCSNAAMAINSNSLNLFINHSNKELHQNNLSISGTITQNSNQMPIKGVKVLATPLSDTTLRQQSISDNSGNYTLNFNFVGIENSIKPSNNLQVSSSNGELTVQLNSNHRIKQAHVYNLMGIKIGSIALVQNANGLTGSTSIHVNQIVIVQVGKQVVKHWVNESSTTTTSYSGLKQAAIYTEQFHFQISHPDTLFQAIDTIMALSITENQSIDFTLSAFPSFEAYLFSAILMPEPIPDALIEFTNLNDTSQQYIMDVVHPSGGMYEVSIPIPALATNKLLPDTIPYKVETYINNMRCQNDTLRLSHGEYVFQPNCVLFPEYVYASATVQLSDSLRQLSVEGARVNISNLYGNLNNISKITNANGVVTFDSIAIAVESPLYINGQYMQLNISHDDYYILTDTVYIDYTTYNFSYKLLPVQQSFYATLSALGINSINNEPLTNASLKIWQQNMSDTLTANSNTNGFVLYDSITIPAFNQITPDTALFYLQWTAGNMQTTNDSIIMTSGNYNITTAITPVQQAFFAQLSIHVSNNTDTQSTEGMNVKMFNEGFERNVVVDQGYAIFDSLAINPLNEITPDTMLFYIAMNEQGFEPVFDSILLSNGEFSKNVTTIPTDKPYSIVMHTVDQNNNANDSVHCLVLNQHDSTLLYQGISNTLGYDTASFRSTYPTLFAIVKTSKAEYHPARTEVQVFEGQNSMVLANQLITYPYQVAIKAINTSTGNALDSLMVEVINPTNQVNDTLYSFNDSLINYAFTAPGHVQELGFIFSREGMINDTVYQTIVESVNNSVIGEMDEEEPEQQYAYLWRGFIPEINQPGTKTDIIIKNEELGYSDTIISLGSNDWWQDTVPVKPSGTTEYEIEYKPRVAEGKIPLYDLKKTLILQPNMQSIGMDTLRALEQVQKVKGKIIYNDTKENVSHVDLVVFNSDGSVKDSIRTMDGTYSFIAPAGFEGFMNVHIPEDHPERKDTLYGGEFQIPIVKYSEKDEYGASTGRMPIRETVTDFKDTIKWYNIDLTPQYYEDPETGMMAKVNFAHINKLDGNNAFNIPQLTSNVINVFFKPENENKNFMYNMVERVSNNFGIPFVINEVQTTLPVNGIHIESLDSTYIESKRDSMGINVAVIEGTSGIVDRQGTSNLEDVNVYTTLNLTLRGPFDGIETQLTVKSGYREVVHRYLTCANIDNDYYVSIGNGSLPRELDTAKMVYDHINYNIIYNHRKNRTLSNEEERTHNGHGTTRPNNASDFYSTKTQEEFYSEERWKNWDDTNIPEYNQKFFE